MVFTHADQAVLDMIVERHRGYTEVSAKCFGEDSKAAQAAMSEFQVLVRAREALRAQT